MPIIEHWKYFELDFLVNFATGETSKAAPHASHGRTCRRLICWLLLVITFVMFSCQTSSQDEFDHFVWFILRSVVFGIWLLMGMNADSEKLWQHYLLEEVTDMTKINNLEMVDDATCICLGSPRLNQFKMVPGNFLRIKGGWRDANITEWSINICGVLVQDVWSTSEIGFKGLKVVWVCEQFI